MEYAAGSDLRRVLLYTAGGLAAVGLAYQPSKLLTLLYIPLYTALALLVTLLANLAWSYLAARRSAQYFAQCTTSDHPESLSAVVPLLTTATAAGIEAIKVKRTWTRENTSFREPLLPSSPAVSAALDRLIAVILDNHLLSWYTGAISPSDPSFPNAVEKVIREVLADVRGRLTRVDWAALAVSTLLPKITSHLELFQEAQQTLTESSARTPHHEHQPATDPRNKERRKKQSPGATVASEEMDLLLSNKYAELAGEGGLHPAVSGAGFNSRPSEEKHLRGLVTRILEQVMPETERSSSAVSVMAMEVIACAVIRPIIEALADPDVWNRLIDDKAGAIIREQRMVNKLRAALDANPTLPKTPTNPSTKKRYEDISVRSSTRQFESYLRSLTRCASLLEAKRIRNDIEVNLRRARLPGAYAEHSPEEVVKYIDRLVAAKQAIDRRIADLGGGDSSGVSSSPLAMAATLHDLLHQPGALSFFMEFMDRRGRSMLVQFYLTIEGLKNPLEDIEDGLADTQSGPSRSQTYADPAATQALRDDVQLLLSSYLFTKSVTIDEHTFETLRAFDGSSVSQIGAPVSKATYRNVRRAVFAAQAQIYEEMVGVDWPAFQRSDLFVKAMADMPARTIYTSLAPSVASAITTRGPQAQSSARLERSSSQQDAKIVTWSPSPQERAQEPANSFFAYPAVFEGRPAASRNLSRTLTDSSVQLRDDHFKSRGLDFLTGASSNPSEDDTKTRTPLFQDDLESSFHSTVDPVAEEPDDMEQLRTMEAIQEALSSILASNTELDKPRTNKGTPSPHSRSSPELILSPSARATASPFLSTRDQGSGKFHSPDAAATVPWKPTTSSRPTLQHLRAVSTQSQRSSEADNSLEDLDLDDFAYDTDDMAQSTRLAAPGNLELPAEIERILSRIDKLNNQRNVLTALLDKAELTGNEDETKILRRSIAALRREVAELSFQKRQFEMQANENKLLPGRTKVSIIGTTTGQAQGKEFALYLIEVHQLDEDGTTVTAGWLVTRRFSEFVTLHSALKEKIPQVRSIDLPQKRLVTSMSSSLLQQRRLALEKYLQSVLRIPSACMNKDLQAFLSQQNISLAKPSAAHLSTSSVYPLGANTAYNLATALPDILPGQNLVRNLFRSVTSGMEEVFGGPSMLDAIILRLSQQAADFAGSSSTSPTAQNEDLISSIPEASSLASESMTSDGQNAEAAPINLLALSTGLPPVAGEGLTYFTAPIANLLVEVFDLKDKGSWLRRQAIVIILQQVLGGTIERKVREAVDAGLSGDNLLPYIELISSMMWPEGKLREASPMRTAEQKSETRELAYKKLTFLMPDVAASIIGRSNARRGARRLFAVMQNKRLNQHLIYTLLDDILNEIFGMPPDMMVNH